MRYLLILCALLAGCAEKESEPTEAGVIFEFDGCVICGGPCEGHTPESGAERMRERVRRGETTPSNSPAITITKGGTPIEWFEKEVR